MDKSHPETLTHHAMLVVWGQFAQSIGLIDKIHSLSLGQKTIRHSPQRKILEFLVAILAGLEHLQDLSRSAHPIDQDQAVAKAWGQTGWADYSGVSRTLTGLMQAEAEAIMEALAQISAPILAEEVMLALQYSGRLIYDGDLTARPVSNTSTTYPGVAYGHMGDRLQLGYQAAMVSLHSPVYSRTWLSVTPHPGDTVSCMQAEALIRAAEAKTGFRPLRRTDLMRERIGAMESECQKWQMKAQKSQVSLEAAQAKWLETQEQSVAQEGLVLELERQYRERQRLERPYSALAKARQRLQMLQRRQGRLKKRIPVLEKQLDQRQQRLSSVQTKLHDLQQRRQHFEWENRINLCPIQADFRLDAGFGTQENVILAIEMGYELYTKPFSTWLTPRLKARVRKPSQWTRVGRNAEMIAWKNECFTDFPYPLDVALERFHTGQTQRYTALIHYGSDAVTTDLPGWFQHYNARQLIEAGIKEGKNIFAMHHFKVRSAPAIFLQEQLAVFAANFVRWAARWLTEQCPQMPSGWQHTTPLNVKQQVKVTAHTSAWVDWQDQGCLLMFTDHSLFAGRSLSVKKQWVVQLPLPFSEKAQF
jgi:hypothetical protein